MELPHILSMALSKRLFLLLLSITIFNLSTGLDIPRRAVLLGGGSALYGAVAATTLERLKQAKTDSSYTAAVDEVIRRITVTTNVPPTSPTTTTTDGSSAPMRILEVGMGSDAPNLERYPQGVAVTGLDPGGWTTEQEARIKERAARHGLASVTLVRSSIEDFAATERQSQSPEREQQQQQQQQQQLFDAVLSTFVLCSVEDVEAAVAGISACLARPGVSKYGFVEHVRAPDGSGMLQQQVWLSPLQQLVAHNCHLDRPTDAFLVDQTASSSPSSGAPLFSKVEALERYSVGAMWPISEQAWGVLVR